MGIEEAAGIYKTLEINGKILSLRPLGVEDVAFYAEHLKTKKLESLKIVLSSLEPKERKELIQEIMNTSIPDDELFDSMQKPEGIAFMLRRALDANKDITSEDYNEIMRLDRTSEAFAMIMPAGDSVENPPDTQKQGSP